MGLTRVLADSREPGHPWQLPLVLRHAALCRLALPNFCLKLNLKEKKKKTNPKQTKKAGSLFYWTFHLPEVREGVGSGMREGAPHPVPVPRGGLGEGQGHS